MIDLCGGKVDRFGHLLFVRDDPKAMQIFFDSFFDDDSYGGDVSRHFSDVEHLNRVFQLLHKWHPGEPITLPMFVQAAKFLVEVRDPGVFDEPEVESEPEPERPRDASGRFLSEFEIWTNAPGRSMVEVRLRANSQRDYGDWYRRQYAAQTVQEGEYRPLGVQPERTAAPADRSWLSDFADVYNRTPVDQMRRRVNGLIVLDERHKYTSTEFENLLTEASRVGLIR